MTQAIAAQVFGSFLNELILASDSTKANDKVNEENNNFEILLIIILNWL